MRCARWLSSTILLGYASIFLGGQGVHWSHCGNGCDSHIQSSARCHASCDCDSDAEPARDHRPVRRTPHNPSKCRTCQILTQARNVGLDFYVAEPKTHVAGVVTVVVEFGIADQLATSQPRAPPELL